MQKHYKLRAAMIVIHINTNTFYYC